MLHKLLLPLFCVLYLANNLCLPTTCFGETAEAATIESNTPKAAKEQNADQELLQNIVSMVQGANIFYTKASLAKDPDCYGVKVDICQEPNQSKTSTSN